MNCSVSPRFKEGGLVASALCPLRAPRAHICRTYLVLKQLAHMQAPVLAVLFVATLLSQTPEGTTNNIYCEQAKQHAG